MEGPRLNLGAEPLDKALLVITPDELGVAYGSTLHVFNHAGSLVVEINGNGPIQDIGHDGLSWWLLTEESTYSDGQVVGAGGAGLLLDEESVWVVGPDALTRIGDAGEATPLTAASGRAAVWGTKLVILDAEGIVTVSSGESERVWSGEAIDLAVNDADELVILQSDGTIRVFVDETAYSPSTQLHAWTSTFIEKPRNPESSVPCRGNGETIDSMLATAAVNLELLGDLPAPTALGITPSHWKRAVQCDAIETLRAMVEPVDLGILFHHAPAECEDDQSCYEDALLSDLSTFSQPPSWVSGLGAHTELGVDWVQALRAIDAPKRFAFFGLSMRPDVPHDADIRAKDSWPSALTGQSRAWTVDEVAEIIDGTEQGWLYMLPGDNVPAFNLGGCANLFLNECHPLGRGNGGELNDSDIQSLDLLLHRALASSQTGGLHTWNFHLPDIGVYDYTDGCVVENGIWTGEACEGARLQKWLTDVDQRFAWRGFITWSTPGTLDLP